VIVFPAARSSAQEPGYQPPAAPPYAPPPGYSAPPPGYSAPPPGYSAPPPGYYQPAPVTTVPAFRRGFLAMPYLGVQIPVGSSGDSLGTGLRLGAILGGHVIPELSLNGELTIDIMNPKNVPSGMSVTEVIVDLVFSPLLHFGTDQIECFVGPKIGAFGMSASLSYQGASESANAQGLAYGLNAGVAFPVGNLAIGGLLAYTGRHATKVCSTASGGSETCDTSPSGDDMRQLSITGMVLF
jgi:hypothetical protein